ncbi:hypothetical protein CHUAL_013678 [Chamberlinius hualienensis]
MNDHCNIKNVLNHKFIYRRLGFGPILKMFTIYGFIFEANSHDNIIVNGRKNNCKLIWPLVLANLALHGICALFGIETLYEGIRAEGLFNVNVVCFWISIHGANIGIMIAYLYSALQRLQHISSMLWQLAITLNSIPIRRFEARKRFRQLNRTAWWLFAVWISTGIASAVFTAFTIEYKYQALHLDDTEMPFGLIGFRLAEFIMCFWMITAGQFSIAYSLLLVFICKVFNIIFNAYFGFVSDTTNIADADYEKHLQSIFDSTSPTPLKCRKMSLSKIQQRHQLLTYLVSCIEDVMKNFLFGFLVSYCLFTVVYYRGAQVGGFNTSFISGLTSRSLAGVCVVWTNFTCSDVNAKSSIRRTAQRNVSVS